MARIMGGDPRLAARVLAGDYAAWTKSVPDNMQFADCTGGLQPISLLVDDARKQEIDAAIDEVLKRHPLPDEPDMVPVTSFLAVTPSRWYYTKATTVKGWSRDDSNSVYVPKA